MQHRGRAHHDTQEVTWRCAVDVPLGGSLGALKELEQKLGIDLTSGFEPNEFTPSKL